MLPGNAISVPIPSRFLKRLEQNAIPTEYHGPKSTAERIFIICCTGAHLLPAIGMLIRLPSTASAINTPAKASFFVNPFFTAIF